MATSQQQSDFIATYGPLAQDIGAATGLDPSVVLGQAAQETGWGQHVQGNNIFGISPGGSVASYPDVPSAAQAYVNLIKTHYPQAAQAANPDVQANAIASGGYNPSPGYGPAVSQIARQIRQVGFPQAPAAPASSPAPDAASDDAFSAAFAPPPKSAPASAPASSPEHDDAFSAAFAPPAPPTTAPAAAEMSAVDDYGRPIPSTGPTAAGTSVGRILDATAHGIASGFGSGPIGIAPQTEALLSRPEIGITPGTDGGNALQRFNDQWVVRPLAAAGDLVARGAGALYGGYQAGVAQAGTEVGSPQLGRDLAAIPDAFAGSPDMLAAHAPEVAPEAAAPAAAPAVEAAPAALLTHEPAPANPLASGLLDPPQITHLAPDGSGRMTQLSDRDYFRAYGQQPANPLASNAAPSFVPPGARAPAAAAPATPTASPAFVPPSYAPAAPAEAVPVAANPLTSRAPAAPSFVPPGAAVPTAKSLSDVTNLLMGLPDAPLRPGFVPPGTRRPNPLASVAAPVESNPLALSRPVETAPEPAPAPAAGAPAPAATASPAAPSFVPPDTRAPEPAAPVSDGMPAPQGVGADTTAPGSIPEPTPVQKAVTLQKMVSQSAEDRLTPQGRDDNVYFPGVVRPEAMRNFTPAADGEMSTALEHKTLYNTDSNYHDQFDAQVKKNNDVMVDGLNDMFGDANSREAAMEDARALMPGSVHLFDNETPVDAQPIADKINSILAGPAGKIDGVSNTLKKILPKLQDADGNLETMPSQIKGIFDDINNKLFDKSPTTEGSEARQAASQLQDVKKTVSDVIGGGLPGTSWDDYLTNLSGALGRVNKLDFMQRYLTGSKKLTDLSGNLQLRKVQGMLEDIQKQSAQKTGGARQMTMDEINTIEAARNELSAKKLLDDRAGVRGSPTAQLTNAAGALGSGPLGAAVRGAGELGTQALLLKTTGGLGNAALAIHRGIVKPALAASKAVKAANALAAQKARLLDTEPNPLASQ